MTELSPMASEKLTEKSLPTATAFGESRAPPTTSAGS